jgi:hypothetical protein
LLNEDKNDMVEPIEIIDYRFPDEFKTAPDKEHKYYDYALLKLAKKVPLDAHLTLEVDYSLNLREQMQIYGYNGDSVSHYDRKNSYQVGLSKLCTSMEQTEGKLFHNISTLGGQRGSPITRLKKIEQEEQHVVSAIHQGVCKSRKLNLGLVISPEIIKTVGKWKREMEKGFIKITSASGEAHIEDWLLEQSSTRAVERQAQKVEEAHQKVELLKVLKNNSQEKADAVEAIQMLLEAAERDQHKVAAENARRLDLLDQQLEEERKGKPKLEDLQKQIDNLKKKLTAPQYAWDPSTSIAKTFYKIEEGGKRAVRNAKR